MNFVQLDANLCNQLLLQLAEKTSEAFILLDCNLNILILNQKAKKIFRLSDKMHPITSFPELCRQLNIESFINHEQISLLEKESSFETSSFIHHVSITWFIQVIKIQKKRFYLIKSSNLERITYGDKIYQYQTLLENTPCNVYWVDKHLKMIDCNQNVLNMLNMSRDEFKGKSYEELSVICNWPLGLSDKLKNDDISVIKTGMPIIGKEDPPIPHADGSFSQFLTSRVPLRNKNDQIIGIAGISTDIASLKEAKNAAEKAKYMMTEFISNMGHDLATPITDVATVAMMLDEYSDEYPELKDLLQTLSERAGACEAVRKRILNATSLSNLEVKLETFSVIEVILALEKKFRSEVDAKKLKWVIHPLKPKKDDVLTTDREKFSAILEDLLSNAINFTDTGSITISIIKENDIVHIEVADTGIGIPADKFDYIFEPYTKLAASNQYGQTFKGAGCGLYLVEVRTNILEATISVESEVGKGSTFTLSIPAHPKK